MSIKLQSDVNELKRLVAEMVARIEALEQIQKDKKPLGRPKVVKS